MYTIQKPRRFLVRNEGPLALHIRRVREWYGTRGMTQEELAYVAGLSPRVLRKYESARTIPPIFRTMVLLALALEVPVEHLVEPRELEEMRLAVGIRRRCVRGGDSDAGDSLP